jgi:hypothetical protein
MNKAVYKQIQDQRVREGVRRDTLKLLDKPTERPVPLAVVEPGMPFQWCDDKGRTFRVVAVYD